MLSKEILDKFNKLYKDKYDIDLTSEQTTKLANDLVNLMRILMKPEVKKEEQKEVTEEGRINETISIF
jgi:hypothetical protein